MSGLFAVEGQARGLRSGVKGGMRVRKGGGCCRWIGGLWWWLSGHCLVVVGLVKSIGKYHAWVHAWGSQVHESAEVLIDGWVVL